MSLREQFTEQLKTAMLGRDAARVSILRMITARLKDVDIAARPGGSVSDEAIVAMLRGMAKSRRESVELYEKGGRADLVAKEQAEIAVVESFLPATLGGAALAEAVRSAIAEAGAASMKDMGRVMAALKTRHGAALDAAAAGAAVKAALAG